MTVRTLIDLCRRLVNHRIQPYYLHQLDRVHGAGHFEVPVSEGLALMKKIRNVLPGYAVPACVSEEQRGMHQRQFCNAVQIGSLRRRYVAIVYDCHPKSN